MAATSTPTTSTSSQKVFDLKCELCRQGYRRQGYRAPQETPDLVALRLQAEKLVQQQQQENNPPNTYKTPRTLCPDRLFVSRLPLNVCRRQLEEWLRTPIQKIQWLVDKRTGAFYGSCIVQVDSKVVASLGLGGGTTLKNKNSAESPAGMGSEMSSALGVFPGTIVAAGTGSKKRRKQRQQPRISQAMAQEGEVWPPACGLPRDGISATWNHSMNIRNVLPLRMSTCPPQRFYSTRFTCFIVL